MTPLRNATPVLPRRRTLQAALWATTERLAHELGSPGPTPPEWSLIEWRTARAAAAIHGVSSLLSSTLRWEGPPGWQRFLAEQRAHIRARHERLQESLDRLDGQLREAGVAGLALKGAALHALGIYLPGERPMADLDILVREADRERAVAVLNALGFVEVLRSWKESTFVRSRPQGLPVSLGESRDRDVKIELHTRIRERLPLQLTDITATVFPEDARPGLNPYPGLGALMSHLLVHAAGAMAVRSLRMLHLHDLARLAARMSPRDWREVIQMRTPEGPWWALPPLVLTSRYHRDAIPAWVLAELTPLCHRLLRHVTDRQHLTDVSLSRPWVDAFPGLAWTRSLPQLLGYVRHRIRPGEEEVAVRRTQVHTDDWAATSPWCALPQSQRMLRWLLWRPARPQTLHAVQAALALTDSIRRPA